MRVIYSSVPLRIDGVSVRPVGLLPPKRREWVARRQAQLIAEATMPERMAAKTLCHAVRQAFFLIRERCYFLDFFYPDKMVAVEIDGSSHRLRKDHDRRRDADFRSIGIRTIRVRNKDVMGGRLLDKINQRMKRIANKR